MLHTNTEPVRAVVGFKSLLQGLAAVVGGFPQKTIRLTGELGQEVWTQWDELRHTAAVIGTVLYVCVRPRHWVCPVRNAFLQQVVAIGVESIWLVSGLAVFVGITVVVQLTFWVTQAGQSLMLGPLLVTIVARELSPVLVGIVVIVHSGSLMATELGIMKISGQPEVLDTQEVSPLICLVMPRVLAAAVSTFCLTVIFILVALASGYVFGAVAGKGSHDLLLLVDSVSDAVRPKDGLIILGKSTLPALFAGASCCIGGLDIGGSLTEVPQATQRALVRSVAGLLVISSVISFLTYL